MSEIRIKMSKTRKKNEWDRKKSRIRLEKMMKTEVNWLK